MQPLQAGGPATTPPPTQLAQTHPAASHCPSHLPTHFTPLQILLLQPSTATTYPKSLLDMTEPINGNELRTAHKPLPFLLQLFASFIMTTIFTMAWLGAAVPVAFLWRELVGLEW